MASIILNYRPWSDAATLSGGSWSLPLTNTQNRYTSKIARSTNAANTSTRLNVVFGASELCHSVYLRNLNASVDLEYRIRGYSDAGMTDVVVDTLQQPLFPSSFDINVPWNDPNFWGGQRNSWDDPERYPSLLHVFSSPVTVRAFYIQLFDAGNATGYLQFDRLFIANYYKPAYNYTWSGNGLTFEDNTQVEVSLGGVEYFDRRLAKRVFTFGFDAIRHQEAFAAQYDIIRRLGADGEILVIPDPADAPNLLKRSFIGRLVSWGGLTQVKVGRIASNYQVRELL